MPLKGILRRGGEIDEAAAREAVEAAGVARRNFKIGVVNGTLGGLLDPLTGLYILTLFLTRLNAPLLLVGLLPTLWNWGIFLPQVVVAGRVRGKRRVMPWYTWPSVFRVVGITGLAVSAALVPVGRGAMVFAFFACFLLYAISTGISSIPFIEVVGKIVPDHRKGTFYGMRMFGSGITSMIASVVATAMVSEQLGLHFPYNFAALLGAGALSAALVFGLWSFVREPDLEPVHTPEASSIFRLGLQALRHDRSYRFFTLGRLFITFASIANPFYVVYASKAVGLPMEVMGLYMLGSTVVSLLTSIMCAPVANKASRRTAVMMAACLQVVAITYPLAVVLLSGSLPHAAMPFVVAPIFLLTNMAATGSIMLNDTALLKLAPNGERPTYFGFLNSMAGIASSVLPLGGLLLEWLGYVPLFAFSAVMAIAALLVSTQVGVVPRRAAVAVPRLVRAVAERMGW